jgi:homoserine kinase
MKIHIKAPATTANLGPGFDALGLALDLWNESTFEPADDFSVYIEGEGKGRLTQGRHNLIIRSARKLAEHIGKELPPFVVRCVNQIPSGSGLGSSAAATLTGLLAAKALTKSALTEDEILRLATEIEGHPDNIAPALMGGLVVSTVSHGNVLARKLAGVDNHPSIHMTAVVPNFHFPTKQARGALPRQVKIKDAVHNISRVLLVVDALRTGDLNLLSEAMIDKLHQPYRIPLIPGAQAAMDAMEWAGASAVALSGAGPSLIAFSAKRDKSIGEAGEQAFAESGLDSRVFPLKISQKGAEIHTEL